MLWDKNSKMAKNPLGNMDILKAKYATIADENTATKEGVKPNVKYAIEDFTLGIVFDEIKILGCWYNSNHFVLS